MSLPTFTPSVTLPSVGSNPSKSKDVSSFASTAKLKPPEVDSTLRIVRQIDSKEFLNLEEEVSHWHCHPFDVGLQTRKPDLPDSAQESLIPKDPFAPFKLVRVCGRLKEVPAINFTNGIHKSSVLYAASNAIILLDYFKNTQRCLQGHKNMITTLVADSTMRHVISGDSGKDCCMIVWDISLLAPIKLFPSPHDGYGIVNAAFSGSECLIATLGAEEVGKQKICIWTYDHRETKLPLSTCDLPPEAGIQKSIIFCDIVPNYFATLGDTHMLYYTYTKVTQTMYVHKPKVPAKFIARMKKFTGGIWMNEDKWFATTTMLGYAIVWEKPMGLGLKKPLDITKNVKEYKRSFKLSDHGITCFHKYKNYLVAGDEKGILRFFDTSFKIVRWTPNFMMSEPVTSISFNLTEHTPDFTITMNMHYSGGKSHIHHEGNSIVQDYTFGGVKTKPLSETTIERAPLIAPDFTLCTESGCLYYCHFMGGRVDLLVPGAPAPWIAFDVCPNTSHVVFTTRVGDIQVYDYSLHKMTINKKVFRKLVSITCMKFHPLGELVFFGAQDGHIYLRHNYTWLNVQPPLISGANPIQKMTFSTEGSFMACCDTGGLVALYHFDSHRGLWSNFGKNIPHTKDVVDLKFCVDKVTNCNRFFSLGADRRLIEYDLYDYGSGVITILSTFYVEQTCIPTAMTFVCPEEFGDHVVLIHNKINKFRIFDYEQGKVMKTCQGPLFGGEKIQKLVPFMPTARKMNTNSNSRQFILFYVENRLGLITTPVDGNPNRYMSVLAHPENILDVTVGPNQQYIFTIGRNDKCVYLWEPVISNADAGVLLGGAGITPFTHILRNHWPQQDIVRDIDLTIFHLNLKRVQTQSEMISMPKTVRLNEMAAVCRTCGFFLTEYEIDVMLTEAIFMIHLRSGNNDQVTFDEFIKMFANHFYRTTHDDAQWAFSILGKATDDDGLFIPGESFLHYMCGRGEPMPRDDFDDLFAKILKRLPAPVPSKSIAPSETKFGTVPSTFVVNNLKREPMSAITTVNPDQPSKSALGAEQHGAKENNEEGAEASAGKDGKNTSADESSLLAVPRRIELLKFLDAIFPLACQDAMKVEGKEKDENKDLQKLTYGKMYKSQNVMARTKARQHKRYFMEKTNTLLNPDNPLYEKLLTAFEAQIFQLTGKAIGREEIIDGARAYLFEKGPLFDHKKKKGGTDSESDSDSSKKKSDVDEPVDEEIIDEEVEEETEEEADEEEMEEEEDIPIPPPKVVEKLDMYEEEVDDLEDEDEDHVPWTDPMNIVTTEEDETWLNEDIEEVTTHDEFEPLPLPELQNFVYDEVGQPDEYLSLQDGYQYQPNQPQDGYQYQYQPNQPQDGYQYQPNQPQDGYQYQQQDGYQTLTENEEETFQ